MFAAIVGQSWAIAAHPYNIEVNGVDVIGQVDMSSIVVDMAGPGSDGSLTFTITDPTAAVTVNAWDEVRFIEHAAVRPVLWGGFVQSVRYIVWATTGRDIEVRCVGYGVLLDRKVIEYRDPTVDAYFLMPQEMQKVVSRYGGILQAPLTSTGVSADVDQTIPRPTFDCDWGMATLISDNPQPQGYTIRGWFEHLAGFTATAIAVGGPIVYPVSQIMWVDAYRRVNILPNLPAGHPDAVTIEYADESGLGPYTLNIASGTVNVVGLVYEQDDIDRLTGTYVTGTDLAGSGYYYDPGTERAGDLVGSVSVPSTTADDVINFGRAEVAFTSTLTVRGDLTIQSSTPISLCPGRRLVLTVAQLGVSSESYRVTGMRITFPSATAREYVVSFGGQKARPSLARRTGRFERRLFGINRQLV